MRGESWRACGDHQLHLANGNVDETALQRKMVRPDGEVLYLGAVRKYCGRAARESDRARRRYSQTGVIEKSVPGIGLLTAT